MLTDEQIIEILDLTSHVYFAGRREGQDMELGSTRELIAKVREIVERGEEMGQIDHARRLISESEALLKSHPEHRPSIDLNIRSLRKSISQMLERE